MQKTFNPDYYDHICYILELIIRFTNQRHDLITHNIADINDDNFVPLEFPVQDFAKTIENAIVECICSERLLLKDTDMIRFGVDGSVEVESVIDEKALELFEKDINAYMELQADKLSENSVNNRVAKKLLHQRQQEDATLTI